jgi:hypothetical protein
MRARAGARLSRLQFVADAEGIDGQPWGVSRSSGQVVAADGVAVLGAGQVAEHFVGDVALEDADECG